MENVPNTPSAWMWWIFSVVLVSLLVNIASAYAKPLIDNIAAKYSERRKRKIEERDVLFQETVANYNSMEGVATLRLDLLTLYLKMTLLFVATIFGANAWYYSSRFFGMLGIFYFWGDIINDMVRAGIYLIGLISTLFLLNRRRLLKTVMNEILHENPEFGGFFQRREHV